MGIGIYPAPLCSPNAGWEIPRGECPRRCNACFQSRMPVPFHFLFSSPAIADAHHHTEGVLSDIDLSGRKSRPGNTAG